MLLSRPAKDAYLAILSKSLVIRGFASYNRRPGFSDDYDNPIGNVRGSSEGSIRSSPNYSSRNGNEYSNNRRYNNQSPRYQREQSYQNRPRISDHDNNFIGNFRGHDDPVNVRHGLRAVNHSNSYRRNQNEPRDRQMMNRSQPLSNLDRNHEERFSGDRSSLGDDGKKVIEKVDLSDQDANDFGTIGRPEILSAESLPDDDDGFDVLEKRKGFRPAESYAREINRLIRENTGPDKVKRAMDLFEEMVHESRVAPTKWHYTRLIRGCADFGLVKQAFELFDQMGTKVRANKRSIPTPGMVTNLFNCCAEAPLEDRALAIEKATFFRDFLDEKAFVLNTAHYNVMIKTFAKLGDMKTAMELVGEMTENGHPVTDLTFCMLLMGCISDTHSGFSNAIMILRKMDKLKIGIDIYTMNLLLRCTRDCGVGSKEQLDFLTQQWIQDVKRLTAGHEERSNVKATNSGDESFEDSSSLYKTSESNSNVPSLLNYSSALVPVVDNFVALDLETLKSPQNRLALVGGKDWVYGMMDKYKMKPTAATMTTLLQCLPDTVKDEDELLRMCDSFGVKLDVDFFNILIKRRSFRAGASLQDEQLLFDIDDVVRQIHSRALHVNIMTFGVMALSCGSRRRGLKLIEDMRNSGLRINIEIMGALIKNACITKNTKYLRDLLEIMEEEGIAPTPRSLEAIESFKKSVDRILFDVEKGFAKPGGVLCQPDYVDSYNEFKLFYKKWLMRQRVEIPKKFTEQFEFEIRKDPRHKMDQFEKEMKERLRSKSTRELNSGAA